MSNIKWPWNWRSLRNEKKRKQEQLADECIRDLENYLKESIEMRSYNAQRCKVCEMALMKEILLKVLEKENMKITFPDFGPKMKSVTRTMSYRALMGIKAVIQDESLNDRDCFERIELIIQIFDALGSPSERHGL